MEDCEANRRTTQGFSESRFQLQDQQEAPGAVRGGRADPRPPSQSRSSDGQARNAHPMGQSTSTPSNVANQDKAFAMDSSPLSDASLPLSPSTSSARMAPRNTPKANTPARTVTPRKKDAAVVELEASLFELAKSLDQAHAKLAKYELRCASKQAPPAQRHVSAVSHMAGLKAPILPPDSERDDVMKIQLKLHRDTGPNRASSGKKRLAYQVTIIKSNKERVPRYRFHHVEISRNILSPNTSLKFIPHLRDMKDNEEDRYRRWINELEALDVQSGLNVVSSNRSEKAFKMLTTEMAIELSFYIDHWIKKLGLENLSKDSLVRYMATQPENDDKMTPQQKTSIMNKLSDDVSSPRAVKAARLFTEAFNNLWEHTGLTLEDVLVHDETVEAVVENKKLLKDGKPDTEAQGPEQVLEAVESSLATYTILGCLFCYSHSCEHGEHDQLNYRRAISVDVIGRFGGLVRERLSKYLSDPNSIPGLEKSGVRCRADCWIDYQTGNQLAQVEPWSEDELQLLRGMFLALGATNLQVPCLVSTLLDRRCWEVYRELQRLQLDERTLRALANVDTQAAPVKNLPWYDRFRKELKGDWQEHLLTQEFTRRENKDPCSHLGPCDKDCPCIKAKLLCDRFCRCTAENCAYKYTGCACHANGKTCLQHKVAGRPCICVQLNRECDPVLCVGCGAVDRADPQSAYDDDLHATGCQNVALQRGVSKTVLLGESQIKDSGYGLFTAEDIAADEFVIEYVGELISHDEGVRREARRGDVFDDSTHSSYLFTLLDYEGIWVDAAIYGNLSRYINHASEVDKVGKKRVSVNIIPQILFVNGDFRIKFKALRDIKAGEELFFNYGENFTNLTKKMLDAHDGEGTPKRGGSYGRGGRGGRGRGRGRGGRGGRGRGGLKLPAETKTAPVAEVAQVTQVAEVLEIADDEDSMLENMAFEEPDDDDDDDFRPKPRAKPKRGGVGLGPRGGRKRKREVVESAVGSAVESVESVEPESDSPAPPRPLSGPGSRGGKIPTARRGGRGGGRGGGVRGGSRGGARGGARHADRITFPVGAAGSATTTAAFALAEASPTGSRAAAATLPVRESPRAAPHATLGTPSSKGGRKRRRRADGNDDDDDDPDFRSAIPRSGSSTHSPNLRRRPQTIPDSDDDMFDAEEFNTPRRRRSNRGDTEERNHDGSSSLDRSQRPRQMPARYRNEKE